ncbi:hypothetical protein M9H77_16302 [Catharanthus roseus]|uniref:Uncharacterized protein n=1 Tax=Catharanthus roseus TaxID=4058 RepID=A0ACC0B1F1_CATRO|nr:hypothetical protein M9H77_16302 [Catharanthus roseus]
MVGLGLPFSDHLRKQPEEQNWLSVREGHPIADSSPAPTITGRLLPAEFLEFLYLPLMIKELSEDKIVESHKTHVVDETSKEEPCCTMNEKSIGIKEKERAENKDGLVVRLCILDSIYIFSRESELLECSKEKENEFEKSKKVKENECFIEKQESEKEEQREKEIVVFEMSEEVNFYANGTSSFFASELLCVQNFGDSSKGAETKEGAWGKSLKLILEELSISLSLIPSFIFYEVSFMKLKFFLESYLSHGSIYGDLCAISFGGGLFLVVPYVSKCLSSHAFLEDSLLHSGSMFHSSCYDFEVMNNGSIESIVVCFGLDGALFDILHKCLGKFIENVGYVFSFLDTFMEDHNDFVSLNQLMPFVSGQVEFSFNKEKLSNGITSSNTLFENAFGFQFYHLHFEKILLKDFENRMGANLELFKANPLAFENFILRKVAFG